MRRRKKKFMCVFVVNWLDLGSVREMRERERETGRERGEGGVDRITQ